MDHVARGPTLIRLFAAVAVSLISASIGTLAQGIPQPTPNATACAYLPIADLEAHFRTKAQNVRGLDQPARNTCNVSFGSPLRAAMVERHAPTAADQAMSAAQRLEIAKAAFKGADTKDFGAVGCLHSIVDMGQAVHSTTCFLARSQYFALSVQSPDAQQAGIDAVKGLFDKTAARRR